jgi:thermitase
MNTIRSLIRQAAAATALCALFGANAIAQAQAAPFDREWVKGRLIVQPRAGLPAAALDKVLKPFGGKARRLGGSDLHVVEFPAHMPETVALKRLATHPHLKFAQLDHVLTQGAVVNDPYAGSQWHLDKINAPIAWNESQGEGVVIAVLDTGITASHPDLAPNLVPGGNSFDGSSNTSESSYHGTTVSGVAAAVSNNGIGVAGTAGRARVMPIRVTGDNGRTTISVLAAGMVMAVDKGARVVNASWYPLFGWPAIQAAGHYIKSKNGLLIVCVGNTGADGFGEPEDSMVLVGATDQNDQLWPFSTRGPQVAISAPGVGIWTTWIDGGYSARSGTSYAAPIVAGVAAMMMASNPQLSSAHVEQLLYSTSVDLGPPGRDEYFGHGRVDAAAAVRAARAFNGVDATPPTVSIILPSTGNVIGGVALVDVVARDNLWVARVDLLVDGVVIASSSQAPYWFGWDSSTVANGRVQLTAVATDSSGNTKTSSTISLTVSNTAPPEETQP